MPVEPPCPKCHRNPVTVVTDDGRDLELVKYVGPQLWGLGNRVANGLRINRPFKALAYVEHECTRMPETIGDAAGTPMQEFPSLGDPGTVEP